MTEYLDRRPLVSIIIPSFNQGRYIRETIESCLQQDYRPIEILVMDGGSRDDTVSVLQSIKAPELTWVSEPDRGVVDAVNKGLRRSIGAILTIQSSDDVFLPGALSAMVAAFLKEPALGLVYGDVELIDEHSQLIGVDEHPPFDLAEYLGRFQYIPQPATCFTRRALDQTGGWRDTVSYAADADLWMRIAVKFPVANISRRVGRYRYHVEQRDTQKSRIARDWQGAVTDLIESGLLDSRQRRFARMGLHLARYRYAPESAWVTRTGALYAAALCNPMAVVNRHFPKRELVPARTPIWAFLSGIKRRLGLHARSS